MKNFKGEIIIRPKEVDRHTIENIGNSIHQQLVGNQDYIDSRIVLNDSSTRRDGTENEIHLIIFNNSFRILCTICSIKYS